MEIYIEELKKKRKSSVSKDRVNIQWFKAGSQNTRIAKLNYLSKKIPFVKYISSEKYKKVSYFHIFLKAEVYKIYVMRTIQLFSVAFNMNNNNNKT